MVPAERILKAARETHADVIGLSGLITPSLEEMAHVARELQREGVQVPLLIGGATTTRAHTAVKLAPLYAAPVVHVVDASRAPRAVASLVKPAERLAFVEANRAEQERLRAEHAQKSDSRTLLPIETARARRTPIDWSRYAAPRPEWTGARAVDSVPVSEIARFIDWSPFFVAWDLIGTYPRIFEHHERGARARELFDDAQRALEKIEREGLLTLRAAFGLFPAASVGDDVEVYADESRARVVATVRSLRQQAQLAAGRPNHALADFIAPRATNVRDYLGAFAVSSGFGVDALLRSYGASHDDYGAIMLQALADRLAEALAEQTHKWLRDAWAFGKSEDLRPADLIRERYCGIRPAPGYPACPDHSEKRTLFELLEVERRVDIRLTENFAMVPASSTCAWVFSHPDSTYFSVGRIGQDQLEDYARRKGWDLETARRWLAPLL